MALDKSAILAALKPQTEEVEIPGGTVIVSQISATDYINLWTDPTMKGDGGEVDMAKFTPRLVAACVVDEAGNRIFTDEEADLLGKGASKPFAILADAARRLNGLSGEETKNSEPSPNADSSSDSA